MNEILVVFFMMFALIPSLKSFRIDRVTRLSRPFAKSVKDRSDVLKFYAQSAGWDSWNYGSFPTKLATIQNSILKEKLINDKAEKTEEQPLILRTFDSTWSHVPYEMIKKGNEILLPYTTEDRKVKFKDILNKRTDNVRFVFENPSNTNNIWAALRTLDSFGVQFVDIILEETTIFCEWRKGMMTTALGSQKWMTIRQHATTAECLSQLQQDNYLITASDLHSRSIKSNDIQWKQLVSALPKSTSLHRKESSSDQSSTSPPTTETSSSSSSSSSSTSSSSSSIPRKIAIVMGNEKSGISSLMRDSADHLIHIPMKGFAESLNLSVAVAVLCTQLDSQSMMEPSLTEEMKDRLFLTWLARTVKASEQLLRKGNFQLDFISKTDAIQPYKFPPLSR
jgi:tRNA (guanosine-2'-O-)-methyltransferase